MVTYSHLDPLKITSYYGGKLYRRSYLTNLRLLIRARSYKIVHVHVHQSFVRRLRAAYSRKKLIAHFHGEDVRFSSWKALNSVVDASDAVFYAQPDLSPEAPEKAVYLPIPVDTSHFFPSTTARKSGSALYFIKHQKGEDPGWPLAMAERMGLELDTMDRRTQMVRYSDFPSILNRYEYYFDRNYPRALSSTALQALACGLKVVDWKGDVLTSFPAEHSAGAVVDKLVSSLKSRGFDETLSVKPD